MQKKILLVDDEAAILRSLTRLLRRAKYKVFTANSGAEALEILATEQIPVVLSDFRMPAMTGGELLAEVKQRYPDVVGLVLSGYADLDAVTSILNEGVAFKFLHKPWDDHKLLEQIESAYARWEEKDKKAALTRLVMESDDALFEIDQNTNIAHLNPAACQLCRSDETAIIGRAITEFIPAISEHSLLQLFCSHEVNLEVQDSEHSALLHLNSRPSSPERWVLSVRRISQTGRDIPGLLNRGEIIQQVDNWLKNGSCPITTVYLDVKNFQSFNDSFGYHEADKLLVQIATTLMRNKPEGCELGRMSGDEFVLMLPTNDECDIKCQVRRFLAAFDHLIPFAGHEVFIDFSVGYAQFPADGNTTERLLRNAQAAANHAKHQGRRTYARYLPAMNAKSQELMVLQSDLYRALEREELSVVYQPKVSLKTGNIVGAETLVRWNHKSLGMISPAVFIPLAEANGLIEPIGEWVLSTASVQSKIWQQEGLPSFLIAVNLSGRQLQVDSLTDKVRAILTTSGLSADQLELEVTETFMMQDIEHSLARVQELKDLGIRIALDDFGTGYSSLNYLSRLPVDTLKIDRSFITGLPDSQERFDLVRNVIQMSHDLGMQVVAEGVETRQQLDVLKSLDCDEIQGFYFSPPVPADQFRQLLENQPLIGAEYSAIVQQPATAALT